MRVVDLILAAGMFMGECGISELLQLTRSMGAGREMSVCRGLDRHLG